MSKKQVPATSKEAFKALDPEKINAIHKKILKGIEVLGLATWEDLAFFLNLQPERVWRRLSELGKAGLIHRPGDRKMLKSGRQGMCWKLGPGKDILKQKKKLKKEPSVVDFSKAILNQQKLSQNIQNRLF